jgi:cytochrome b6-f complex iron-sulfur subunit
MADQRNLSVEEILSACRAADGGGEGTADTVPTPEAVPAPEKPAGKPKAATGDPTKMSVAEMLAAARAEKTTADTDASDSAATEPAADKPPAPTAKGKKPTEMSVAEMLAAARGGAPKEKQKPAAKSPAAKKPTAKKPAVKKEVSSTGPMDTASILAMARKSRQPGPISKAEAASQGQVVDTPKRKMPEMPARPAYVQPVAPAANDDRRSFFGSFVGAFLGSSLAVGFSSLAVTNLLWVLGGARFMFPNILTETPTIFKVGFPADYSLGQVQTKYKAQFGVWVIKAEYEGVPQVYALKSVCTHLGCTPNWLEGEQKFKCPCHGSGFYMDGVNFEGPAPRPLERYAIRVSDDGQLEVDKSQTFQQELGQWSEVASFVTS